MEIFLLNVNITYKRITSNSFQSFSHVCFFLIGSSRYSLCQRGILGWQILFPFRINGLYGLFVKYCIFYYVSSLLHIFYISKIYTKYRFTYKCTHFFSSDKWLLNICSISLLTPYYVSSEFPPLGFCGTQYQFTTPYFDAAYLF